MWRVKYWIVRTYVWNVIKSTWRNVILKIFRLMRSIDWEVLKVWNHSSVYLFFATLSHILSFYVPLFAGTRKKEGFVIKVTKDGRITVHVHHKWSKWCYYNRCARHVLCIYFFYCKLRPKIPLFAGKWLKKFFTNGDIVMLLYLHDLICMCDVCRFKHDGQCGSQCGSCTSCATALSIWYVRIRCNKYVCMCTYLHGLICMCDVCRKINIRLADAMYTLFLRTEKFSTVYVVFFFFLVQPRSNCFEECTSCRFLFVACKLKMLLKMI